VGAQQSGGMVAMGGGYEAAPPAAPAPWGLPPRRHRVSRSRMQACCESSPFGSRPCGRGRWPFHSSHAAKKPAASASLRAPAPTSIEGSTAAPSCLPRLRLSVVSARRRWPKKPSTLHRRSRCVPAQTTPSFCEFVALFSDHSQVIG